MKRRTALWLAAIAVLIVVAANAHLVYVAVTSQPDCVAHRVPGGQGEKAASFSAARSDCSPPADNQNADNQTAHNQSE